MFEFAIIEKRYFWKPIDSASVGGRIRELGRQKKDIEKCKYEITGLIGISTEKMGEYICALDDEIKLCKFYYEYNKKAKDEQFNTWKYEESFKPHDYVVARPCWVRTNGKLRAIINLVSGISTTDVKLTIENDSKCLEFMEKAVEVVSSRHLKNKESINAEIERLKKMAELKFKEHEFPRYKLEVKRFENLKKLLHIEG